MTAIKEMYILTVADQPTLKEVQKKHGPLARIAKYPAEPVDEFRCKDTHNGFVCTRKLGHPDFHEAHVTLHVAVGSLWGPIDTAVQIGRINTYKRAGYKSARTPTRPFYNATLLNMPLCPALTFDRTRRCNLMVGHPGPHEAQWEYLVANGAMWTDADTEKHQAIAAKAKARSTVPRLYAGEGPYTRYQPHKPAVYVQEYPQCGAASPHHAGSGQGVVVCTRKDGHDGPHEPHVVSGQACGPCWFDVPKG